MNTSEHEALLELVRELGGTTAEIDAATRIGGLGPLALDLAMRPPGESLTLDRYVATRGEHEELTRELWQALGLPTATAMPFPVTPDLAEALDLLVAMSSFFGREIVIGFARVAGMSTARLADALSNASRVSVEVPDLHAGTPYAELTRRTGEVARDLLPPLWNALGAIMRRQLVLVSYQQWSTDQERVAITLDRTIGFVDLVGSTELVTTMSVAQLAALVEQFEERVWETVTAEGGRVVKLIGDEAMFVVERPMDACRAALRLVASFPQPVRVGLAHGPVVALRGDYYGAVVNLAARLVQRAPASSVLASQEIEAAAAQAFSFDRFETGQLRGFAADVAAFRVGTALTPGSPA